MRPLPSSNFSIEGMLFSTFVRRRAPQKPEVIVTACTGTFRSLAWGDLARFKTPWSFGSAFSGEFGDAENDVLLLPAGHESFPSGSAAAVIAETVEFTN